MDFKSLFESLPILFTYFIPGFVFIKTFSFFVKSTTDSFESTAVASVAISYVLEVAVVLLESIIKIPSILHETVVVLLAFLSALIIVKLKTMGALKSSLKWIGKITDHDNIWQDIFDLNKGSRIRCFSRFNHQDVMIQGDVKFFDICEDGECSVALINYIITYDDGKIYKSEKCEDAPTMYINTRNVHGLEVKYGK